MEEMQLKEAFFSLEPSSLVCAFPLTTPLPLCFDWRYVCSKLQGLVGEAEDKFYVVVFRSKRRDCADSELLYTADADAHDEAKHSGGLLMYWYGSLNERRECFATCIWKSREDAVRAMRLPKHAVASKLASEMYDFYNLEKYWLRFTACASEPIFETINGNVSFT